MAEPKIEATPYGRQGETPLRPYTVNRIPLSSWRSRHSVTVPFPRHGRRPFTLPTLDSILSLYSSSEPVVWTAGSESLARLNGETGELLFAGGGPDEQMTFVRRFQTPIAVNGRIFVAADNELLRLHHTVNLRVKCGAGMAFQWRRC